MVIPIPDNILKLQLSTSTVWLDDRGVMYSAPTGAAGATNMEQIRSDMQKLRTFLNNKKVCIITEAAAGGTSPPKDMRDFIADEINSITKAMAIISTSPLSRMIANLFFSFKPPPYPYKMCNNLQEANDWIKKYV